MLDRETRGAIAILESAAFVLMNPEAHCKDALALTAYGYSVPPLDKEACRWCAVGSLVAANDELINHNNFSNHSSESMARKALDIECGGDAIGYNDSTYSTAQGVARKMWQAAERLREGWQV